MESIKAIIKNKEEFVNDKFKPKIEMGKIVTSSNCSKGLAIVKKFVIFYFN